MTLTKYKALVIEDEDTLRKDLVNEINESLEIEVVGEAFSISTAYHLITHTPADVMFLDIKLIEGSSLDLIKQLKENNISFPPIVITTGYRDFNDATMILNELKDDVILLINKPFWKNWSTHKIKILANLDKRFQSFKSNVNAVNIEQSIVLPDNRQLVHIIPSEIIAIKTGEKRQGKTLVLHSNTTFDCNLTLTQLMEKLPDYFIQVSRFETINSKQISIYKQVDRELIMKNGYKTIVGSKYHLNILNLLSH